MLPSSWSNAPLVTGISNLMASLHRFSFLFCALLMTRLRNGSLVSEIDLFSNLTNSFHFWPMVANFFVAFHERNEIIASVCGSTWKSIRNGKWGCLPTDVTSRNERMADVTRHHWLRLHNPSISFSMEEDGIYLVNPSIITPGYTYWPTRRLVVSAEQKKF